MTSQSHSPLAEPKPTPRALGPNRHPGRKAQPCACARAKNRKKIDCEKFRLFWAASCVDTRLWTKSCGHKVVDTRVVDKRVVDTRLWTKRCGHNLVDNKLWTQRCGKTCGQSCGQIPGHTRTLADKLADTRGQSCGHERTKLRTNLRTHAEKAVDTRGQSCGHTRTSCGQSCGHMRTNLRTHADKVADTGGQSGGHFGSGPCVSDAKH